MSGDDMNATGKGAEPEKRTKDRKTDWAEPKPKRRTATWEDVEDRVYVRLEWYATRYVMISAVGVVLGVVALVYSALSMLFLHSQLQNLDVIFGVLLGVGLIIVSLVLLAWGLFWRKKAENRSIFK